MTASEQSVIGEADPWRGDLAFSAVEVGGSAGLGADVRLDLAPRVTVLVGKNGAGKSLFLEKLQAGFLAVWAAPRGLDPTRFACEVDVPATGVADAAKLRYECRFQLRDAAVRDVTAAGFEDSEVSNNADIKVEETCRIIRPREQLLWRVDDGLLTYSTGDPAEIAAGRTLVSLTLRRRELAPAMFPAMAYPLLTLFSRVNRVPAGVPRGDGEREELILTYPEVYRGRARMGPGRRIRRLAYVLIRWHESDRELFAEFVELGRRTGLLEQIKVKLYRDPEAGRSAQRRDLASVLVDGTDLGLLSDGTLRVAEILMWLVFPELKLLLVEEPEAAVHPGLLSRLLAEFDAYAADRQIVLSTQSPQVVSWADPHAIRLVERHAAQTQVRRLHDDEFGRLSAYLHDEGTLGDFVYSGALDG